MTGTLSIVTPIITSGLGPAAECIAASYTVRHLLYILFDPKKSMHSLHTLLLAITTASSARPTFLIEKKKIA